MRTSLTRTCPVCGKFYQARPDKLARGLARFCGRKCGAIGRNGNPRLPILQRFLEAAQGAPDVTSCWLWRGTLNDQGYGRFWVVGDHIPAHKVAHLLFVGPVSRGLFVLHRCDTPGCVNPRHLFLGTQKDNMDDARAKGRDHRPRGEECGSVKLSAEQILQIRSLHATGEATQETIAKMFKICPSNVRAIVRRKTWKHLP